MVNEQNGPQNPSNEDELYDFMSKAVSEGNNAEVDRLMGLDLSTSSETSPNATPPPSNDGHGEAGKEVPPPNEPVSNDAPSAPAGTPENTPSELEAIKAQMALLQRGVGRVDYLQSQLAKLEKANKELVARANAPAPTPPVDRKVQEKINKLKDIDPDLAETLESLYGDLEERTGPLKAAAQAAKTDAANSPSGDDAALQGELARVQRVHPDAVEVFRDPSWNQFKNALTPEQRAWAESESAEEVVVALAEYKRWVQSTHAAAAAPVAPSVPAPVDTSSTTQARERKLQQSAPNRNAAIKSQGTPDEDAMFSEMYKQILSDNHIG